MNPPFSSTISSKSKKPRGYDHGLRIKQSLNINYFNPDSLTKLVERCGFDVVEVETTFPIDLFLLMEDNYVADPSLGRRCHAKRKALELNLAKAGRSELKQSLYRAFAEIGLGREVVLYARCK